MSIPQRREYQTSTRNIINLKLLKQRIKKIDFGFETKIKTKTKLNNFWINQDEGKLRLMVHLARLCRS